MKSTKNSTRTLTVLALLIAMSIVFSRVLSISTGFVRFNLGSLPVLLAGIVFGPGAGFAVGALADMIGGILAGYAINPLIMLGAASIGLVGGWLWQTLPHTLRLWPAAPAQCGGGPCGGLYHHQLAGAPHFLWLRLERAGSPCPQRADPDGGEHRAAPAADGE